MKNIKKMDIFVFKRFCECKNFTRIHISSKNQDKENHNCMDICCTFERIRVDFNPNTITFLDFKGDPNPKEERYASYISFSNVETIEVEELEDSGWFLINIKCNDFIFTKQVYEYKIIAR